MPFPLLDLPPEIREKIYLCTLTSPAYVHLTPHYISLSPSNLIILNSSDQPLHPLFPLALLLTCHQVYHEVRPLYFVNNSFLLTLARDPEPFAYFRSPDFIDNRRRVRSLKLVIVRWGKHDFFLREMAPLLEDMILNGSLRDLEVWVRLCHFVPRARTRHESGDWDALERMMQILEDPYLEKVVLKRYDRAQCPTIGHKVVDSGNLLAEDVTSLITRQPRDPQLRRNS